MQIACVGQSAAARISLQKFIDNAYQDCRSAVGHLSLIKTYPASREELLVNAPPDVVCVSELFSLDEAYSLCREVHAVHPALPVFVFLSPERYSLRSLRRLEGVSSEVFSTDDPALRVVHKLLGIVPQTRQRNYGKLVTVTGAKGGVGTTSIVSGLAHAAQAIGKNSTVLDLSPSSAFAHYMAFPKWQSPDYAAVLVDNITPDEVLVERCMATAPNGITVLLAPAGGNEIREIWLRDPSRFEITLAIVDHLLELFDVVLVDQAGAEGVLPFALNCRADCRLLIAGNDAASVHLLSAAHTQMLALPGSGCVRVLQNNVHEFGLTTDDFLDFLYLGEHFEESMMLSPSVPYESKGRHWIGTGNTFYTESGSSVQEILERSLRRMINEGTEAAGLSLQESRVFSGLKRLLSRPRLKRQFVSAAKPVPRLEQNTAVNTCPAKLKPSRKTNLTMRLHLDEPPAPDAERIVPADDGGLNTKTAKEAGAGAAEAKEVITNGFFYQPPQVQDGLSNPDA